MIIDVDLDAVGIPGTVEKVSWENWESQDGAFKKEGVVIHIKGWNFPIRWGAKYQGKRLDGNCALAKALGAICEAGITTKQAIKDKKFDLDQLVGKTYIWGNFKPWPNLDTTIRVPVATADDFKDDSRGASTTTQSPEDRVLALLANNPSGLTTQALTQKIVESGDEMTVELWFSGLREKVLSDNRIENNNGTLRVRAAATA